jgi:RNA polymerase sigma-70 factor (ECF subfamily)
MNDQSDEDIMQDFQNGKPEGAEVIFHRYNKQVLNFCLRILGNRSDAEDATGDVFLALFSGSYRLDPRAKFSTWLFTIARHCCIDKIRKRKNTTSLWFSQNGSQERQHDVMDSGASAADTLEQKENAALIREAIFQLPLQQREALVLREYHQMSYQEIAQILGLSLENVKIQIFRAREQLRGSLADLIKEMRS